MPTQCGGKRKDTEEALLSLKGSLAQLAKAASIVDGNTGQEYQRKKLRKTLEDTTDWIFELFTEVKSNGRTHSLHFACPGKTMRFLSHRCPNWAQVGAFLLNRPTLECVVFEDEITGGNVVAPDPHRKVSVVYLGFWVLGEHLCDAKFWLPVCCCRHQLLVDHEGGGSGLMTMILGRLFLEPQILYHKDQSWKCKLVLRNFLADAPALRSAFSTKGANGMRPCALCSAVIGKRWDVDGCCSFDETNMDRWCRCTDSELRAMAAELRSAAQHESLAVLRKMEKTRGLTYNEHSVLYQENLRGVIDVARSWTYDSMHSCYQNGTGSLEMFFIYKHMQKKHGCTFEKWRNTLEQWSWHSETKRKIKNQLCAGREKTWETSYKGSASELISLYPCVVLWCQQFDRDPQLAVFFAMWEVISALEWSKREPDPCTGLMLFLFCT